jgi:hypothetical protein
MGRHKPRKHWFPLQHWLFRLHVDPRDRQALHTRDSLVPPSHVRTFLLPCPLPQQSLRRWHAPPRDTQTAPSPVLLLVPMQDRVTIKPPPRRPQLAFGRFLHTRVPGVGPVHLRSLLQQSLFVWQLWRFTLHFHRRVQVMVKLANPDTVETARNVSVDFFAGGVVHRSLRLEEVV